MPSQLLRIRKRALSEGESAVFTQIYSEEFDGFWKLAWSYLRDKNLADDAVQEAFARSMASVEKIRNRTKEGYKAYIAITIRNIALNQQDYLRRHPTVQCEENSLVDSATPEEQVLEDMEHTQVQECLKELPDSYRRFLWMKYICDMEDGEVRKSLDIRGSNYRMLKKRSLDKLRRILRERDAGG